MSPAAADKSSRESNENVRRLVDRAQQGDRDALEELYLIHFDRIYGYLHMSVGNRHDAEDLTTQTFLKMLESVTKFRWGSAPFSRTSDRASMGTRFWSTGSEASSTMTC